MYCAETSELSKKKEEEKFNLQSQSTREHATVITVTLGAEFRSSNQVGNMRASEASWQASCFGRYIPGPAGWSFGFCKCFISIKNCPSQGFEQFAETRASSHVETNSAGQLGVMTMSQVMKI